MKKINLAGLLSLIIISCVIFATPKVMAEKNDREKIPGQYIVVFKEGVDSEVVTDRMVRNHRMGHLFTYGHIVKGFAATIPQGELEKVKRDSSVAYVIEDRVVTADGRLNNQVVQPSEVVPTGVARIGADSLSNDGAGVAVAVLDTGIDLSHPDLAGSIIPGSGTTCIRRTTTNDDNGHGTHVAGTIAARDNAIGVVGVAPLAKLIPVKVLDSRGSGTWSSVICGIDWVTGNAIKYNIKVVNMSLGGGGTSDNNCGLTNNDPLHRAICRSRDAGITYVVAAGNEGADSLNSVPAAYDDAVISVSALTDLDGKSGGLGSSGDDTFASFSNYGSVVDIAAPGLNIFSTYKNGGYATMSGTSMATPHVTGAAALYLAKYPGTILNSGTFRVVRDALNVIGEKGGVVNNIFYHALSVLHPESVLRVDTL